MTSKHTSVTWKWSDSYQTFDGRHTWSLIGANGYGILSCDGVPNSPQGLGPDGEYYARLIAAAPDLLDIAVLFKRTIEFMIRADEKNGDAEGANLKRVTLGEVDTAIAKARGE